MGGDRGIGIDRNERGENRNRMSRDDDPRGRSWDRGQFRDVCESIEERRGEWDGREDGD